MLDYMREMIEKKSEVRVAKAKIIEGYQVWCQRNGLGDVVKMSPQRFWNTFKMNCKTLALPFQEQTSNGVRYLKSLSLRDIDGRSRRGHQAMISDDDDLAELVS